LTLSKTLVFKRDSLGAFFLIFASPRQRKEYWFGRRAGVSTLQMVPAAQEEDLQPAVTAAKASIQQLKLLPPSGARLLRSI